MVYQKLASEPLDVTVMGSAVGRAENEVACHQDLASKHLKVTLMGSAVDKFAERVARLDGAVEGAAARIAPLEVGSSS